MVHGLGVAAMTATDDKAANLRRIADLITEGADKGAAFIVFPELCVSGYPDLSVPITSRQSVEQRRRFAEAAELLSGPAAGPSIEALTDECRRANLYVQVGLVECDAAGDHLYNAVAIIGPDGLVGGYRKTHNPFEHSYFNQGDELSVTPLSFGGVGSVICYDVAFPEVPRILALRGASVIAMSAAWGSPDAVDHDYLVSAMELAASSAAFANHAWLLLANQSAAASAQPAAGSVGRSQIIGPDGVRRGVLSDGEGVLVVQADVSGAVRASKFGSFYGQNMFRDRRPELYGDVLSS